MAIDTSSATAIVRFSGLGVLCFNGDTAENLFLHEAGHTLTVEIYEPLLGRLREFYEANPEEAKGLATLRRFPDDSETSGLYKRLTVYEDLDASQLDTDRGPKRVGIKVTGEGNPALTTVEQFHTSTTSLDRLALTSANENDFRWMVNATGEHFLGNPPSCTAVRTAVPTTKLEIENARVYTETLAADDSRTPLIFKKVENVPSGTPILEGLLPFGMIADEMGAMIDAEKVKVEITIGAEVHTHMLPKITGRPYIIYIKNNAAVSASDMPIYKNLFVTTGLTTFDLLTEAEILLLGGSSTITGREFCSGIYAECPPSVDSFIPLT